MNHPFNVLPNNLSSLIIFVSFLTITLLSACSSKKEILYSGELARLKAASKSRLSSQISQFNSYKDRPPSDGPFNETNNQEFLLANVPLFLSSDTMISKVYNYRWWMISKHLKEYHDPYDDKTYWVVTEFFGVKPWASLSGAITCPAGHQFYDVRWLRDDKYLKSYADYFMNGSASKLNQRENGNFLTYLTRPESHHFSSWMINGVDAYLKVHPNKHWLHTRLPDLENHQQVWDSLFTVKNSSAKTDGMYKILDLYNGMEFSLSAVLGLIKSDGAYSLYTEDNWKNYYLGWETTGNADRSNQAKDYPRAFRKGYPDYYMVRPSLNSYAYGNLKSLSDLYELDEGPIKGNSGSGKALYYENKAAELQHKVLDVLWNNEDQFFNSYSAGDNEFGTGDYEAGVRESVGYSPWYFGMIPKENYEKYGKAWEMFSSPKGFYNKMGMTTAEQQHPYYNEQAYAWNGRGWPYENSVVYKGYANYLRNYKSLGTTAERQLLYDYVHKLALMHGAEQPNIGEWYIPSNGIAFGGEKDYFHSSFPDIIIEDLLGFVASHKEKFSIAPILPETAWEYFYLGNIRYHNHDIDIVWKKDWQPDQEGNQSMLCVWVDNKLVAKSDSLNSVININLTK